jgi:hypothetical protein
MGVLIMAHGRIIFCSGKLFLRIFKICFFSLLLFLTTLWALAFSYQRLFLLDSDSRSSSARVTPVPNLEQIQNNPFWIFPNSKVHWQYLYQGKIILERNYFYDSYMFRVPLPDRPKSKYHVILGGCSFSHGIGLEVNETLAYLLQQKLPPAKTYNLGFPGGGVTYLLKYFELYGPQKIVNPQPGVFLYVFMDDHLVRFHSLFSYLEWSYPFAPVYAIQEGKLEYKGGLDQQFKTRLFNFLRLLQIQKVAVALGARHRWSENELHNFALAVQELKTSYLKKFPEREFIFLFHPLSKLFDQQLKPHLQNLGINYLDPRSDFFKNVANSEQADRIYRIPIENHPNGKLNLWLSTWLASELNKMKL